MTRNLIASLILAGSIAALAASSHANAQSPDPALLAPGQSGRMMAPPRYTGSQPSYASAGPRGVYRSRHGARPSHPSAHNH
jgi:hypothetical protein